MSNYSQQLEDLYRKAPQATGMLEAIELIFQGNNLYFCKSNQDKRLKLSATSSDRQEFKAAGFEVSQPQVSEQQKQSITISFPSAGTELYRQVNFYANNRAFFNCKVNYFQYYIEDFIINPTPAYTLKNLFAFSVSVNSVADVQIQATTDNLNTYNVGDLYTYDKFPSLRNQ
tara:strand:- start:1663 stop:2178 length:516 start_codon:yes stop_codon:yes gene_type:complete